MADLPATRASLLVRLGDHQDHEAWREFVRLYAPMVYRFGRRKGMQDADAADLTQEVLRSVSGSVATFDAKVGPFRNWLFTLAHRRWYDFVQRRQRETPSPGGQATMQFIAEAPAPAEEESWNQEYERQLFALAAELIRPKFSAATWQAFQLAAIEGKSGEEVARALGISVAAVYLAKSRVMVKLKAEVGRLRVE
jgi:RNA polymerase sigma factor (sigma-70 family)